MGINVQTIRASFDLVKPMALQVVDRFYDILFTEYPAAKPLFAGVDMQKQKAALIGYLAAAVDNLDKPDPLTKLLLALGERHGKYGVEDEHYEWVGQSLLKAFSQTLGAAWSTDLEQQWASVYGLIAEAMKAGARNSRSNVRRLPREGGRDAARNGQQAGRETTKDASKDASKDGSKDGSKDAPRDPDSVASKRGPHGLPEAGSLALPEHVLQHIRSVVGAFAQELVDAEVRRCFDDEMQRIKQMNGEQLAKKAG